MTFFLYLACNSMKNTSIAMKLDIFCLHIKFYKVRINYFIIVQVLST
jgi:hypothetical protein